MISGKQIAEAKANTQYQTDPLHEHDDCIRIAYEWLDAQPKLKGVRRSARPIKHIIESWGGRYVSQGDVEVAAQLHPDIHGEYPYFNISAGLIEPNRRRLAGIGEAGMQASSYTRYRDVYRTQEP